VLPSLDVPGVAVRTYAAWAEAMRRITFPSLNSPAGESAPSTPPLVMRAKSHGAMLKILADRQAQMAAWCRAELQAALHNRPELSEAIAIWDTARGPVDARVTALARWVKGAPLSVSGRTVLETVGRAFGRARATWWASGRRCSPTARSSAGASPDTPRPIQYSPTRQHPRWCVERERLRLAAAAGEDDEVWALDEEDNALLLRIHQLQRGPLGNNQPIAYDHLMVDEVQDFAPVELAVLLDSTNPRRSITLAGDTNQSIVPNTGSPAGRKCWPTWASGTIGWSPCA